jgi:hypothetical protein
MSKKMTETMKEELHYALERAFDGGFFGLHNPYSRGMVRGVVLAFCALQIDICDPELKGEVQAAAEEILKTFK